VQHVSTSSRRVLAPRRIGRPDRPGPQRVPRTVRPLLHTRGCAILASRPAVRRRGCAKAKPIVPWRDRGRSIDDREGRQGHRDPGAQAAR
jgi:hypothetical protein